MDFTPQVNGFRPATDDPWDIPGNPVTRKRARTGQ